MAEQRRNSKESINHSGESVVSPEHRDNVERHKAEQLETSKSKESHQSLAELLKEADREATTSDEVMAKEQDILRSDEPDTAPGTVQALKGDAFKRSLKTVRAKLPAPARAFSKIIHNETVDTISNVGAQTIARPSGVLGGGIVAFAGSLILLYVSKHYGFRYNYLVMIILFVAGFAAGSLIEFSIWSLRIRRPGRSKP